jgi:hypothetical protein
LWIRNSGLVFDDLDLDLIVVIRYHFGNSFSRLSLLSLITVSEKGGKAAVVCGVQCTVHLKRCLNVFSILLGFFYHVLSGSVIALGEGVYSKRIFIVLFNVMKQANNFVFDFSPMAAAKRVKKVFRILPAIFVIDLRDPNKKLI